MGEDDLDYFLEINCGNFKFLFLTFVGTFGGLFFSQEFFERKCGMGTHIRRHNSVSNLENSIVAMRQSKKLDKHGRFRIHTKSSIEILKLLWKIGNCILLSIGLILYPQWYIDHFYYMIPNTRLEALYNHSAVSIMAFYLWEIMANQYFHKLNISALIHHWLTIIAVISILMGRFNPFATWYGIVGIFINWPTSIMLFVRAKFAHKHPTFTQNGFKFLYYYYFFLTSFPVIGGEIILLINAYFGNGKGNVDIPLGISIIIAMFGWTHDDFKALKAYKQFAEMDFSGSKFKSKAKSMINVLHLDNPNESDYDSDYDISQNQSINDPIRRQISSVSVSGITNNKHNKDIKDIKDINITDFKGSTVSIPLEQQLTVELGLQETK